MYGSSLRMETFRPRALRMRPTLAAVMPLPREEVTPPVTKTYFAMDQVLRGFFEWYRKTPRESNPGALPVAPTAPAACLLRQKARRRSSRQRSAATGAHDQPAPPGS